MNVIGIDTSLTRTGLAALPAREHSAIPTSVDTPRHMRLRQIAEQTFEFAMRYYDPVEGLLVIVEEPGWIAAADAGKAAVVLGMARGAAMAGLPALPNVHVVVVAVNALRSQLGLKMKRGEEKAIVIDYVRRRGITVPVRHNGQDDDDVADAYLLAIYGQMFGMQGRVGEDGRYVATPLASLVAPSGAGRSGPATLPIRRGRAR